MKALRIKLKQSQASYAKEEATTNRMTYPLPPYSTVIGAIHSACDYTTYHPMDLSIQGNFRSMQKEIYVSQTLLNNTEDDRNTLVYINNKELFSAGHTIVGVSLKSQGNSFLNNQTVRILNEPLYQYYLDLNVKKKELDKEKIIIKEQIDTLKRNEKMLKEKQKAFDKKTSEYIQLGQEIIESKLICDKLDTDFRDKKKTTYDDPIAHFRTLVKAPKYQEVLYDIELVIHVMADQATLDDIKKNSNNLVCLGRSEDFVELIEAKEVELRHPNDAITLREGYKLYVHIDKLSSDNENSSDKPFYFIDGDNPKEAKGTVYYLNKKYEIRDGKRIFEKIPCLYSSYLSVDAKGGAYVDEDDYMLDLN